MTRLVIEGGLLYASGRLIHEGRAIELPHLVVDTGSAATAFPADLLLEIGLTPRPDDFIRRIRGVGGTEFVFSRRIDRLEVGGLILEGLEVEIGALDYGFRMDGLIGLDFLANTRAVIDLARMTLVPSNPPTG